MIQKVHDWVIVGQALYGVQDDERDWERFWRNGRFGEIVVG